MNGLSVVDAEREVLSSAIGRRESLLYRGVRQGSFLVRDYARRMTWWRSLPAPPLCSKCRGLRT